VRRWYISFREKNRRKKTEDVERRKETEHVETKKEKQCVETRENYQQSMLRNRKETWGKKNLAFGVYSIPSIFLPHSHILLYRKPIGQLFILEIKNKCRILPQ
jgi:hypothetical protein